MSAFDTCALCPRLCRPACPVAREGAREAAVPAVLAEVLRAWHAGRVDDTLASEAATLCVDCGACQDHCHLHVPLPHALRDARARLLPAVPPDDLPTLSRGLVAVETDDRSWAGALASRLDTEVVALRTRDGLGVRALGTSLFMEHAGRLRSLLADREVVVASGDAARVLDAAEVSYAWLHERLSIAGQASCVSGRAVEVGCCGGASPLVDHHVETAARLAQRFVVEGAMVDTRCACWLRAQGREVTDAVDVLLGVT